MYIRYNFLGTTFWHVLLFVIISYTGEVTTKLAQIYTYCCILMYTTLLADVLCRVIVAIHKGGCQKCNCFTKCGSLLCMCMQGWASPCLIAWTSCEACETDQSDCTTHLPVWDSDLGML